MATRKKPTLLAQGKPRTLGGSGRPWRRAALRAGERWHEVPGDVPSAGRRGRAGGSGCCDEPTPQAEARKIFAQAEAALDTDKETPAGADVRASRPIRMLGEEYLEDGIERGKQPRTREHACPVSVRSVGPAALARLVGRPGCRSRLDERTRASAERRAGVTLSPAVPVGYRRGPRAGPSRRTHQRTRPSPLVDRRSRRRTAGTSGVAAPERQAAR